MISPAIVAAAGSYASASAAVIAMAIKQAVADRGGCSLALCGGSTPVPVYGELATHAVPWADVSIYFGDERAVPPGHRESNFGMAQRVLLGPAAIAPARIHRMEAERPDIDAAAAAYDALLPAHLDLLLLGVGPDGHVASLFPGSPALDETRRRVMAVASPRRPIEPQLPRMTITPPVIAAARQIMILAAGAGKAAVVARALDGPDDPLLPAQLARAGTWLLDSAAAAQLQPRDT